jgi:hypothetical protein
VRTAVVVLAAAVAADGKRLSSLFKVPDISIVTSGGSIKAIVDNILSRDTNLQLIIIVFIRSDRISLIDDFSVAM